VLLPQAFLDRLIAERVASAAVGWIGVRGRRVWSGTAGSLRAAGGAVTVATRFDLSSLTKPFAATLALVLDRSGELALETPLGEVFAAAPERVARVPLARLLRHRSGLPAWLPLEAVVTGPRQAADFLLREASWTGAVPTYSDLGFILWQAALERALGVDFERLLRERVCAPLGLAAVEFRPGAVADVASSFLDRSREGELARALGLELVRALGPPRVGTPQDGNARFLGGVSAHAGLFADAHGVAALAGEWLAPKKLLDRSAVARALGGPRGDYALGWARRRVRGTAGPALSAAAFGHAGFTGTSVWCDPPSGLVAVLLAHRRHAEPDLKPWRREFHALAAGLIAARARRAASS
jgi:CubicO group peptidase (beta-lactamase class C family)